MSLNKSQELDTAKQYLLQSNQNAAIAVYQKIIEADPTDLGTINTLGDLYSNIGRIQDAIHQFTRAADGYLETGFKRKAIAVLKKIVVLDPSNIETGIKLAGVYAQEGLPSEARQHYLQVADAYTRKGQMLDALQIYKKIVELDPSNASTRIKLGELYLREGLNDQAYEAFVTAAERLTVSGENRRALNAYNEALAVKPNSVETSAAATRLTRLLRDAEEEKKRSAGVRPTANDSTSGNTLAAGTPDLPRAAGPPASRSETSDGAFVVQEISKAEILVAYKKVDQAVAMLRAVLAKLPDNVDVHIKLKDIYLRTGMMAEAADECRQLEQIYRTRGEDDRARDYALRASRLTELTSQPSADLHEAKPRPPEKVDAAAPRHQDITHIPVGTTRLDATPVQPKKIKPVITSTAPVPQAAPKPVESPPPVAPLNLVCESEPSSAISEVEPDAMLSLVPAAGDTSLQITGPGETVLPVLFSASAPVVTKRSRFFAAAIAAGVFALLTAGAVVGGFFYNAHLDKQYETLALSVAAPMLPSPPSTVLSEESPPVPEEEAMNVVATPSPQPDESSRTPKLEREVVEKERPAQVQPISEPPKLAARPSPAPPRVAVGSDGQAGADNRTPAGVPTGVPSGTPTEPVRPVEPPPKTVRQAGSVVPGSAIKRVEPLYPTLAKGSRLTGLVTVEVTINEQGNVTSSRALSGPPLLRDAAVSAARGWKFKPATIGGVPAKTTTTIVFNFKL